MIFDVRGRLLSTLFAGRQDAGFHAIRWNGLTDIGFQASTGVYWARVVTPGGGGREKLTLVK